MLDVAYAVLVAPFKDMAGAPAFLVEVLIGGVFAGLMYSLVALGFVLIYKASGVFNFAQGVMVLFAALTLVGLLERGEVAALRHHAPAADVGVGLLRQRARRLNPKLESDRGTLADLSWENFVKEVFLDSETAIGLISTPPGPYPQEAVATSAVVPSSVSTMQSAASRPRRSA